MSGNHRKMDIVHQCLECGYILTEHTPRPEGTSKCPECGTLIRASQQLSNRIDYIGWDLCVQIRQGVNFFTIGIVIMVAAYFAGLIIPAFPWLHLGGTSTGIIVAAAGAWKLSSYYTHGNETALIPLLTLRISVIVLTFSLVGAMILITLGNPHGLSLLRDRLWNFVWLGVQIGITLSLVVALFMLLHLISCVSNWCGNDTLKTKLLNTKYTTFVFGIGFIAMLIWNSVDPVPYDRTIFNIEIYRILGALLALLSLGMIGLWGHLIYSLRSMLRIQQLGSNSIAGATN